MSMETRLAALEDRAAVETLTKSYGLAIDTRDWDLYASLFGKTVEIRYHPGKDDFPDGEIPSAQWVEGAKASLGRIPATQHFIAHYRTELDGESATVTHYCVAYHYQPDAQGTTTFTEHYVYRFGCARSGDGWVIAKVDAEVLFASGDSGILAQAMDD